MQISVTGKNIDVTPPLREYATGKFTRIKRHFDHVTDVHVILSVGKNDQHAEATIHASGKTKIFADARHADMYAAIDAMVDKLDRQILKRKEKMKDHNRSESVRTTFGDT